ncbi:zf-HC2 domain-containing protein [Methylobacterium oryzisoli]|uniref:anti-sigma factor family protein n=1 Tax=Methylobacterium oryzisoli TaxID=3385502 RepID=UPI003892585A
MKCREAAEHASALLDRDLDLTLRARLRLHLAACAPCRRFAEQVRATRDLLRDTPAPALAPDREEALVAALLRGEAEPGAGP